MFKIIL